MFIAYSIVKTSFTGTGVIKDRNNASQVFAEYTISRIPYSVRSTLSDEQLGAIRDALAAQQSSSKHGLDFRLRVPLFFRAYYFVVLGGRDKRKFVVKLELQRVNRLPKAMVRIFYLLSVAIVTSGAASAIFLFLYLAKSFLGFDFFSVHLSDLIGVDIYGHARQFFSSWSWND